MSATPTRSSNFLVQIFSSGPERVQHILDSASPEAHGIEDLSERPASVGSQVEDLEGLSRPRFALIVGINSYKSRKVNDLRGGVEDAKQFKLYLQNDLKVSDTQICFLTNKMATRENIIKNLESIKTNKKIKYGDAIFIFFAGHGAQAVPPPGSNGPMFEVLVTYDLGPKTPGIPDRELCKLLDDISREKGNNITVILDSCHSASATRELQKLPEGTLARAINSEIIDYDLHVKIYKMISWNNSRKNILGRSTVEVSSRFLQTGLKSHVLLAACKSDEVALESTSGGHFSTALLKLLRTIKDQKITYSELLAGIDNMKLMPGPAAVYEPGANVRLRQNPQCVGYYQNRFIFEQALSVRRIIVEKSTRDKLVIKAGTAEGIVNGDQFGVYHISDHTRKKKLGILTVTESSPASSFVTFESPIQGTPSCPSDVFAVRCRTGTRIPIKLHAQSDRTDSLLKSLVEDPRNDLDNIHIVSEEAKAHITTQLSDDGQEVVLRVLPRDIAGHQFQPHSHHIPRNYIVHVLQEVVEYFWHLERGGGSQEITNMVEVEFFRLQVDNVNLGGDFCPVFPSLIQAGHNKKPMVKIAIQPEDTYYGIKLTNRSGTQNLYPYLYSFDQTELKIDPNFTSSSPATGGRQVESPLKAGGDLTLGYGSGGVNPFEYGISEGQDVDLVTLKILIFTEPVDQQAIPELSPFGADAILGPPTSQLGPPDNGAWVKQKQLSKNLRWGTITIPIVLYRP